MHNCLCCNGAAHGTSAGGRRRFMAAAAGLFAAGLSAPAAPAAPEGFKTKLTPDGALRALRDGTERFVADAPFRPDTGSTRRAEAARGQGPFASVLARADGRVAPELVSSRGIGELFVVSTAGNTADAVVLGSVEYPVAVLGSPCWSSWGTPPAARRRRRRWRWRTRTPPLPAPSARSRARSCPPCKRRSRQGDLLGDAVRENAVMVAQGVVAQGMVARTPVLQDAVREEKPRVVAAHCGLADGRVEFLGA